MSVVADDHVRATTDERPKHHDRARQHSHRVGLGVRVGSSHELSDDAVIRAVVQGGPRVDQRWRSRILLIDAAVHRCVRRWGNVQKALSDFLKSGVELVGRHHSGLRG